MRIVSSIHSEWHREWTETVVVHNRRCTSRVGLFRSLLAESRTADVTVLLGSVSIRDGYVDLLAGAAIAARGGRVVFVDATWEPGTRALRRLPWVRRPTLWDPVPRTGRRLAKLAIRVLARPSVHFCVLSSDELVTFPAFWGVPEERVHLTPFSWTIADPSPEPGDGSVFAGGNSLRDYRSLIKAAQGLDVAVTIATRLDHEHAVAGPRVHVGPLDPRDYDRRMRDASVVVVPLIADTPRSAGQQTYLSAMALGKVVIVTDSPGVRDYVDHGRTGLIVRPGDAGELRSAIAWALDPANASEVAEMRAAARARAVADFTPGKYLDSILAVARRVGAQDASPERVGTVPSAPRS